MSEIKKVEHVCRDCQFEWEAEEGTYGRGHFENKAKECPDCGSDNIV